MQGEWRPQGRRSEQVYERDAISSQLEQHHSDPITRLPLRNDQLTPVYLLRARAAEYRESAAAACVDAASSPGCAEPVRALFALPASRSLLFRLSPFARTRVLTFHDE